MATTEQPDTARAATGADRKGGDPFLPDHTF
jgi:hypothetical protein